MAVTVTGVSPLTPVPVPLEKTAPRLPVQTAEEGGNSGAVAGIPNNNGKVPDSFYGIATPSGAGTSIKPTAVNATQGAVAQDDFAALNGTTSSGGKQTDLTKSYSSPAFPSPPQTVSTTAFGIPTSGTNAPAPAYAGGTTYAKGAVVLATDGNAYQSIVAANVGNTPQSSPTKWNLMAPIALTNGPGGAFGASFATPGLLPLWTSAAVLQNAVVGYISVNSSFQVAAAYASGTTYAAGTFVIGTDNNVYLSLQAGNVGNDPTLTASAAFWVKTHTTWDSGTNYILGKQVLLDGVLYVCSSAVTSNRPDVDSTDWGSGVTVVNPWLSSTTYAANAVVEYNNSVYISLQGSNHDQIPGTQTGTTTGVSWWAELAVAPWNSYTNYLAGQSVTFAAATTGITTLYQAQSGKNPVAQNPRVNNQLQIDSDSTQNNPPSDRAVAGGVGAMVSSRRSLPSRATPTISPMPTTSSWERPPGGSIWLVGRTWPMRLVTLSWVVPRSAIPRWRMPKGQSSPTGRWDRTLVQPPLIARPVGLTSARLWPRWSSTCPQRSRIPRLGLPRSRSRTTTGTSCSPVSMGFLPSRSRLVRRRT